MSVHLGQCKYRNYLAKMLLRELLFFYFNSNLSILMGKSNFDTLIFYMLTL